MTLDRLPAHLEVSALLRRVHSEGGFAAVLHKGEADAGTLLVVTRENTACSKIYERMPELDGARKWHCSMVEDIEKKQEFQDYLARRVAQDPDLWLIELDIPNAERFIGLS